MCLLHSLNLYNTFSNEYFGSEQMNLSTDITKTRKTNRESAKNIFCHYRSDNINFSVFWPFLGKKQNGGQTGSGLSHGKNKHQIRAQEVRGILKNIFLFDFDLFDENLKWRPDDVIPVAVNINGSGSNAIPDIPRHFNTSDRNFEKIR